MDIHKYRQALVEKLASVDTVIADMIGNGLPKTAKALKKALGSDQVGNGATKRRKRRKMSAAARKAIGDAQRKRWAAQKGKK